MPEVHLIVVWSKGASENDRIITDAKEKFQILEEYHIKWSEKKFSENLSRFYGESLPRNSRKEKHCGNGTFLCLVVLDKAPVYEVRQTSKGDKVVNTNLFDVKQLYRRWTHGGHKVHATDNATETKHQLALLLNKSYTDYLQVDKFNGERIDIESDLQGTNGWKSLKEVFSVLNKAANYLVLRNYENIETQLDALHPDIDTLCDDPHLFVRLINGKPTTRKKYRVQYSVSIGSKVVFFDVRYVGDNYYCSKWGRELLMKRAEFANMFVPDSEHYFYTLIYHALLHKPNLSDDYFKKLVQLASDLELDVNGPDFLENNLINRLTSYMDKNSYDYTVPLDHTVFWNYKLLPFMDSQNFSLMRKIAYEKYKVKFIVKKVLKKIGCYI